MGKLNPKIAGILTFIFVSLLCQPARATHIRAGEIVAKRLDNISLTFEFTVTGFRDSESPIDFGLGTFVFGDGSSDSGPFRVSVANVGNNIELVTFTVIHTYSAPNGNGYLVSYEEEFRNADILNMANSVGTTFYVETLMIIDPPFFGINNSPILTVPPIDFAAVGAKFIHNPGAYDPDGDSLSYSFTIPKQARDKDVGDYRSLVDPAFYSSFATGSESGGIPTLTLNPITGDLTWDAPGDEFFQKGLEELREYNVAFVITEWRRAGNQWFRQGYVVRDMQIIVEETDNERPTLEVPEDFCVEAGTKAEFIAQGNDADGDPVRLEAFGGPFEVANPATYTTPTGDGGFQGPPGFLSFDWNTVCGHVRERPYEVQVKVTDRPDSGPRLVDFETVQITVVGPAPTGLETQVQPGKSIQLTWDPYACSGADRMQIWRKVGSSAIESDLCQIGMPPNVGFQLIDEIEATTTQYLDTNSGIGLSPGASYCYRLVAAFPFPGGGESYVSAEACDSILIDVPVITHVDITKTSLDDGELTVRWTPPYQIDQVLFPPNYTYDLFRFEGQKAVLDNTALVSLEQIASNISDTVYNDRDLNTLNKTYTYFVRFYDSNNILVDTSAFASTVRLTPKPLVKAIELSWNAVVPWSLRSNQAPYHFIYRDQVVDGNLNQLVLIDSVEVSNSALVYLDNGDFNDTPLDDKTSYCYYVSTNGSYDNILLPDPLVNRSQIGCAEPNDSIPPCKPPVLTLNEDFNCEAFFADKECGFSNFRNTIEWTVDVNAECDNDIQYYNVYFSETGLADDYEVVGTPASTLFIHEDIPSLKGCYRVSAVDRSGNESPITEPICMDNCPNYSLPNAFSPNGDGKNDFFTPFYSDPLSPTPGFDKVNCPRFVEDVDFSVFDRSGNKVFEYVAVESGSDILINWDGRNQLGIALPSGVYFYEARVTFDVLNPKEKTRVYKGWVQLLK